MKYTDNSLEINLQDIQNILASEKQPSGLISLTNLDVGPEKRMQGRFDLYNYKNIAYVGIKDLHILKSYTTTNKLEGMVSMEVMLHGGSDMQLGAQNILNNDMPKIVISSHNVNGKKIRFHKAKENYKGLGIWMTPENLKQLFNLNYNNFQDTVSDILQAKLNHSLIYPVTNEARKVVEEIITNRYTGTFKNLYIEAKITEIFCIIMKCILSPELAFNQDNQLPISKAKAMKQLLSILDNNLAAMPSLDALSKTLGMSKGQISKTFKQSYGMNITDYIAQKRLIKAKTLVNEGKLSVLQIALEVGYTNQSSFGRAFKKYYGYSPLKSQL